MARFAGHFFAHEGKPMKTKRTMACAFVLPLLAGPMMPKIWFGGISSDTLRKAGLPA